MKKRYSSGDPERMITHGGARSMAVSDLLSQVPTNMFCPSPTCMSPCFCLGNIVYIVVGEGITILDSFWLVASC